MCMVEIGPERSCKKRLTERPHTLKETHTKNK